MSTAFFNYSMFTLVRKELGKLYIKVYLTFILLRNFNYSVFVR